MRPCATRSSRCSTRRRVCAATSSAASSRASRRTSRASSRSPPTWISSTGSRRAAPRSRPDVVAARRAVTQLNAFYLRQVNLVGLGAVGRRQATHNIFAGQELFDDFRQAVGRLQARSTAIIEDARDTQRRTYWTTLAVVLGAGAVAIALTIWLLLTVPNRIWSLYDVERGLRESAERGDRASRSLQHVDDAVVLLDADDAIRYWNPAAARYLAVAEGEAVGRPLAEVVPELAAGDDRNDDHARRRRALLRRAREPVPRGSRAGAAGRHGRAGAGAHAQRVRRHCLARAADAALGRIRGRPHAAAAGPPSTIRSSRRSCSGSSSRSPTGSRTSSSRSSCRPRSTGAR